jgi:MFS transporter, FHS family, L-fucose permease
MAFSAPTSQPTGDAPLTTPAFRLPLICMVSLFFLFGFVTVLNDVLIPHLKGLFELTNVEAMLVQFCFFGAYFVVSLPAGKILEKIGHRKGIVLSLLVVAFGLLLFIPASMVVSYPFFLVAYFIIGSGITVLQVAANPYISLLGPPQTAATRINLAGGLNSLASTIGPSIGAALVFISATASVAEKAAATRLPYLGVAAFVLLLAAVFSQVRLPEVLSGKASRYADLLHFPKLLQGAGAIFCYVGAEVAVGSLLINYMALPENGSFSMSAAADYVSFYWGMMMVGRWLGFLLLSKVKMEKVLLTVTSLALLAIAVATLSVGMVSIWALVALGLFHSVMWSSIFPISIAGLGGHTHKGAGLLVMMIVGGAIIPLLQGFVTDFAGFKASFLVIAACYAWILWFAVNKTTNEKVVKQG